MTYLSGLNYHFNGIMLDSIKLVLDKQLKETKDWKKFVSVFKTHDDQDGMWRGEYFGKQIRGASLIYQLTQDEELYKILVDTVNDLLLTQDQEGRISSYPISKEFFGWDMWCRKYVITGLLHFYRICKSEILKKRILYALEKHLDYIISVVGRGKLDITKTSHWWGGVNSCSILEPVVEMYKQTGRKEYLDFAEYIISTGGSSECDFISLGESNKMPYEYPITKAYEIMSFHEGLLAYYEVTKDTKYLKVVSNFIEKVFKSDVTVIGSSGCTHELFDNSKIKQTEYSEIIMQETCVTVTWMRILSRMYLLTKDPKFIDRIEVSGFNALYGSLNTKDQKQTNLVNGEKVEGKAFDSYSPLYANSRGRGIGGYQEFKEGGYHGCCIAIGAAGVALVPLNAITKDDEYVYINYFFNGDVLVKGQNGEDVSLKFVSKYPEFTNLAIKIDSEGKHNLKFKVRAPSWMDSIAINGDEYFEKGYINFEGEFTKDDLIEIKVSTSIKKLEINNKVSFSYGPIALSADEKKEEIDLRNPLILPKKLNYSLLPPEDGEILRGYLKLKGAKKILLTDYQSCGKEWNSEKNKITVWFNVK